MSEGRIRQLYEFRTIGGINRNPSASENNKVPVWNNANGVFDYTLIGESNIDLTFLLAFINNVFTDITTDDYISSISKIGNAARFYYLSGRTPLDLNLGALAWLDEVEATLTLPGNTKVLFDDNDTIGGNSNFTYNKTINKLQFIDTGLNFKTGSESYKEGFKYNGNYSWSIANGQSSVDKAGSYNITSGYKAGYGLRSTSSLNSIYGPYAGELISSTATGNIQIGSYAGRLNQDDNKFYLDNVSYADYTTEKDSSFLYADLETERRLYIRDRLAVAKEGKFGTSGLLDAEGEYGMYQMSATTGGNPQWHDGTVWQDFANSTDTYLNDYDLTGSSLTLILSDLTEIGPIDLSGINTTTFATSPSSPATGKTATSDYGYIQISNSSFTNDEGFTYKEGLKWVNTTLELLVPGALNIASFTADPGFNNRSIWSDGDHAYIKLNGTSIQIDNEVNPVDEIDGENIGGAAYEVFKQRVDNDLQFRTFRSMPIHNTLNPNDRISMSFSTDGDAIFIGTTAEKNRLDSQPDSTFNDVVIDRDNSGETLLMRALRPGTGVTLTQHEEYILIDSTGAGGGEVNTMDNNGAGIEFYADKNGAEFEMYTLSTTDARIILTQATDYTTDPENTINLDLIIHGDTTPLVTSVTDSDTIFYEVTDANGDDPTIWFKRLISDTITFTTTANNELRLETGSAAATGTNLGAGVGVYVDTTAPDFDFKTLIGIGAVNVTANLDGETINIAVDDLLLEDDVVGSGEVFSITQDETNPFYLYQKGFTGDNGISVTEDTTIIISNDIAIPSFTFIDRPNFTAGSYAGSGGAKGQISFVANYASDVRNGESLAETSIFELNIGTGLLYDSATNTLYTNNSVESAVDDYALRSIVLNEAYPEYTYDFTVDNSLGTDPTVYQLVVPKYELPLATYTDNLTAYTNENPVLGGVLIDPSVKSWERADTQQLAIDELTGVISVPSNLVAYDIQNHLLDEFNDPGVNNQRTQARANIGAAYITGNSTVGFNASNFTASRRFYCENVTPNTGSAEFGSEVSRIQNLLFRGTHITTTANNSSISLTKRPSSTVAPSEIAVGFGDVSFVVNSDQGNGTVTFFKRNDAGIMTTLMRLDEAGNLYVKGNIYARGEIEAFDTDNTNTQGIN